MAATLAAVLPNVIPVQIKSYTAMTKTTKDKNGQK